jgi:hypothetical protein
LQSDSRPMRPPIVKKRLAYSVANVLATERLERF